jgi:hypothetical protein
VINYSPRERYVLTNVNGGELLLPYIEASGQEADFEALLSFQGDDSSSISGDSSADFRFKVKSSGPRQFFEITVLVIEPVEAGEAFLEAWMFEGLQIVSDDTVCYGRGGEFPNWIDLGEFCTTSSPGKQIVPLRVGPPGSQTVPLQAGPSQDTWLAEMLFEQASGEFDPRDIEQIEETTGVSPLIDFKEAEPEGSLVFVHEGTVLIEEIIVTIDQTLKIEFRVDSESGLVTQASRWTESSSSFDYPLVFESTGFIGIEIAYGEQDIQIPQLGDASIETDPDRIAAFRELFY